MDKTPGLPKMRLRVSYDSDRVSAEMITSASSLEATLPKESDIHRGKKKLKNKTQNDEMKNQNAITDTLNGMSVQNAASKWDVSRTTLQN